MYKALSTYMGFQVDIYAAGSRVVGKLVKLTGGPDETHALDTAAWIEQQDGSLRIVNVPQIASFAPIKKT